MKKSSSALILDLTQNMPDQAVAPDTIGVAAGLSPQSVIDLSVECGMNHIVQSDSFDFNRELEIAHAMTLDPRTFMNDPLSVIFDPKVDASQHQKFKHLCNSQDNKKYVLSLVEDFIGQVKGTRTIRDDALIVSDELYTNGSKNSGTLYIKDSQDVRPGWVEFVAGSDGKRLVLGCIDSYGALEITMITKRIQKCLKEGVAASINHNQAGGAGIGSFMVFSTAFSMYIGVQPGQKTIVLCMFPLGMRNKEMMSLTKNFHTVVVK